MYLSLPQKRPVRSNTLFNSVILLNFTNSLYHFILFLSSGSLKNKTHRIRRVNRNIHMSLYIAIRIFYFRFTFWTLVYFQFLRFIFSHLKLSQNSLSLSDKITQHQQFKNLPKSPSLASLVLKQF